MISPREQTTNSLSQHRPSCQIAPGLRVEARVLDDHTIECDINPGDIPDDLTSFTGALLVRLTNVADWWTNAIVLSIDAPVELTSLSPSSGPLVGGTKLTLAGTNIADSPDLACYFDCAGLFTRARVLPSLQLGESRLLMAECRSPPTAVVGTCNVKLTVNGKQLSSSSLPFSYSSLPSIDYLRPRRGPVNGT
jgi:hypothetical protein